MKFGVSSMKKQWWHNKTAYQIYPKSFLDTNGDGIGDLRGIISKLDYLKDLGVDIIWISPIFASPMVDQGYDISDYYAINPCFGTMEDMDELIEQAKSRNMYIILDLVVNHCSDKHRWFQEAIKYPDGKFGKFFYIRESPDGKPLTNWRAEFGGSCWTKLPNSENKFYFHTFAAEQPDLNWENPELREEIYKMVNWWLDKGISGFRVDAIINIKKDLSFRSLPPDSSDGTASVFRSIENAHGIDVFLNELKDRCFSQHNAFTIGEVFELSEKRIAEFAGEDGYFSSIFDFDHCLVNMNGAFWYESKPFDVSRWRDILFSSQLVKQDTAFCANIIENHDQSRGASFFIPENDYSPKSVKALASITVMLRGLPFLYQGQEIGMKNCPFESIDEYDDISTKKQYNYALRDGLSEAEAMQMCHRQSRDNARTPMQWDSTANAGFTTGKPWLKVNPCYKEINVQSQINDDNSILSFYKKLISIHKQYEDILAFGSFKPIFEEYKNIIAFKRTSQNGKTITLICNYQNKPFTLTLDASIQKILLSNDKTETANNILTLSPYQTIIFF